MEKLSFWSQMHLEEVQCKSPIILIWSHFFYLVWCSYNRILKKSCVRVSWEKGVWLQKCWNLLNVHRLWICVQGSGSQSLPVHASLFLYWFKESTSSGFLRLRSQIRLFWYRPEMQPCLQKKAPYHAAYLGGILTLWFTVTMATCLLPRAWQPLCSGKGGRCTVRE